MSTKLQRDILDTVHGLGAGGFTPLDVNPNERKAVWLHIIQKYITIYQKSPKLLFMQSPYALTAKFKYSEHQQCPRWCKSLEGVVPFKNRNSSIKGLVRAF